MTGATVGGGEDLGGNDEGKTICAYDLFISMMSVLNNIARMSIFVGKYFGRIDAPKLKKKWQIATQTTVTGAALVCATP